MRSVRKEGRSQAAKASLILLERPFLKVVHRASLFQASTEAMNSYFPVKGLFCVLLLCVTPGTLSGQTAAPACRLQIQQFFEDYEYVQDGDIMVGGVVSVNSYMMSNKIQNREVRMMCLFRGELQTNIAHHTGKGLRFVQFSRNKNFQSPGYNCSKPADVRRMRSVDLPFLYYYKNLLAFFYSVDEINKDPSILPNRTLGYHIYDSCTDPRKAIKSILQILSGPGPIVPNYSCTRKKVVGFIGDHFSSTTLPIAQLLGIYPYTQISYGATDTLLSNRFLFPSFFRTVRNDYSTYYVISHFLSYFEWTWVGIISSDDEVGDGETRLLTNLLTSHGICVAFVLKCGSCFYSTKDYLDHVHRGSEMIKKSSAQIIIICGTYSTAIKTFLYDIRRVIYDKILIVNPSFTSQIVNIQDYYQIFNLSFSFDLIPGIMPDMESYFSSFHPLRNPKDMILEDFYIAKFHCLSGKIRKDQWFSKFFKLTLHKCDGTERLDDFYLFLSHGNTFQMYLAVRSLADAIHNMYISYGDQSTDHHIHQHKHKVHQYLRAQMCSTNFGSERKCFNDKGDRESGYVIYNDILLKGSKMAVHKVGSYDISPTDHLEFSIEINKIRWKNNINEIPKSHCSPSCSPGHRKVATSSIHLCCYDCAPCSEGEISNISDSENCMKCPEDSWSNENRTFCVFKEIEYLSYTEDIISIAFSCLSSFFCILTVSVLIILISNRDTAIVRANNKNLSFVLLVSIMLSFLCVFLFLGRPVDRTCMIRQIFTGILLSISISSLLAKTITVYIAFKATKPGSVWGTWTGVKLPNCVLLICSSVQGVICMSWVTLSPPFQELDTHSYKEKMVIQCNEGSDLWFYSVLGYMGILAAVSFITAFLARTLPDSFNEAKYITFSMLVFCSVWIAMIPAYLSTKGKYMVVMEIFAILTSNAGLLGCIFFPKCFIILFKPELNTRKYIMETKNTKLQH
ncbi:vomeronasal type-2 receptor 26-like [Hyla sarda]|uniref:vomeronasal type-2 receptor 26-like n=1 Tax=Hyla sarda TaxID=327740 RepID=UPI0024C2B9AB|nr:vomeronasal type-2 receptor 26-like [Hyla sarda]